MFKQLLVAILVIMALGLLQNADAIKCYQCKSLSDINCAKEPITGDSNIRSVDCDQMTKPNVMDQFKPVTKCNKVVTKDKAGTIISRDCHFEVIGQKDNVCTVSHSQQVESCYTCTGDLCNSSSSAQRFIAMSLASIIAILALNFIL